MSAHISIAHRGRTAAPRLGDAFREADAEGHRASRWPWRGFVFLLGLGALFTALSARSSGVTEAGADAARTVDGGDAPGIEIIDPDAPALQSEVPADEVEGTGGPSPSPESQSASGAASSGGEGLLPVAAPGGLSPTIPGEMHHPGTAGPVAIGTGAIAMPAAPPTAIGAPQVPARVSGPTGPDAVSPEPDAKGEDARVEPAVPTGFDDLIEDLDSLLGRFPEIHAREIMDYAVGDILREVPAERLFSSPDEATGPGAAILQEAVHRLSGGSAREEFLPPAASVSVGPGDPSMAGAMFAGADGLTQDLNGFGFL
ncbi:hypothetical protein N8I71_00025 [Roseibacterium sp. SDUM158016]|uniref:hypothetical protein n=1 Tax=Roseicyclus sediminis TaxID=2980997 RepID=UPI0021D13DB5|nr:hypothetical protein [Roseibacterium sp. SDUM158016]MCU4651200.1 hypothetical protein [Roseibacterium sp. SDUM158016]